MAKKAVTKKKTMKKGSAEPAKRVTIKKEPVIDFTIDTPEQAREIIVYLKQLETTIGWIYLKKMLQANMAVIERQIITKKDFITGEKLTEDEVDGLRKSYLAFEELVDKPAQLIAQLSQGNKPTAPEYDPYSHASRKDSEVIDAGVLGEEM